MSLSNVTVIGVLRARAPHQAKNKEYFLKLRFKNDSVKAGADEYIPKKLFVVGGDESGSTTTCHGDSGSPVVRAIDSSMSGTRYEVIGLVSWSKGCGRAWRPSVWTRVETFVPWILENMEN